jgi:hypothetical protein
VPTIPVEERDQELLTAVRDFGDDGALRLARYLSAGNDVAPFEAFATALGGAELLTLLSRLTTVLLEMNVPVDDDGHPRGLIAIWRVARKIRPARRFDVQEATKLLEELTGKCLPEHLYLAEQLVHWFGASDEPEYQILPKEEANALTAMFHNQLRVNFGSAARTPSGQAKLLTALRSGREVTLLQAAWGVPAIRDGRYLTAQPFAGWEDVRDSLLAAAAVAPEDVLGPLAWFVAVHERGSHDGQDRVVFRQDVAERLFGTERLLNVYAISDVREFRSTQTRDVYECVKLAATDADVRKGQPYVIR